MRFYINEFLHPSVEITLPDGSVKRHSVVGVGKVADAAMARPILEEWAWDQFERVKPK